MVQFTHRISEIEMSTLGKVSRDKNLIPFPPLRHLAEQSVAYSTVTENHPKKAVNQVGLWFKP